MFLLNVMKLVSESAIVSEDGASDRTLLLRFCIYSPEHKLTDELDSSCCREQSRI